MAKGLGWYMAKAAMQEKAARLEKLEAPACPLCGEPMDNSGAGWFCYAGTTGSRKCSKLGALRRAFDRHAPPKVKKEGHYCDEFQSQLLAGIVDDDDDIVARLETVRGPGGCTNLRIWADDDSKVSEGAARFGWTWMGWVPMELQFQLSATIALEESDPDGLSLSDIWDDVLEATD